MIVELSTIACGLVKEFLRLRYDVDQPDSLKSPPKRLSKQMLPNNVEGNRQYPKSTHNRLNRYDERIIYGPRRQRSLDCRASLRSVVSLDFPRSYLLQ